MNSYACLRGKNASQNHFPMSVLSTHGQLGEQSQQMPTYRSFFQGTTMDDRSEMEAEERITWY